MKNKITIVIIGLLNMVVLNSCKKYLDVKPNTAYSTIATVIDAQQVLNNPDQFLGQYLPNYGEYAADNYYLNTSDYDTRFKNFGWGNVYIWGRFPFLNDAKSTDWSNAYAGILICNTVLNALDQIAISDADRQLADNARGTALTYRGYIYWKLAVIYSKAYVQSTSATDLGIPLRLGTSLDEKLSRGNVQQTYDQVLKDLKTALPLLPNMPRDIGKPSKVSVNAMLAEVYLSMRDYQQAEIYANASLQLKRDLINYNALNNASTAPIPVNKDNIEVLIRCTANATNFGLFTTYFGGNIDTLLFDSYSHNDLRKQYFFTKRINGTYQFSGNYSDGYVLFTGPTTAEMYLTLAECLSRQGKTAEAMEDLNTLLKNRIVNSPGTPFVPYVAANADEALQLILQERRKELIFRDLRWPDIKRLNIEGANITLSRNVDGHVYTLSPNDKRFALQLPETVIQLSGMEQNPY